MVYKFDLERIFVTLIAQIIAYKPIYGQVRRM